MKTICSRIGPGTGLHKVDEDPCEVDPLVRIGLYLLKECKKNTKSSKDSVIKNKQLCEIMKTLTCIHNSQGSYL